MIVLSSQPGLDLKSDHFFVPDLAPGEQKDFHVEYGPVNDGTYLIRIAVRYRAGELERVSEFTRYISAVRQLAGGPG